MGKCDLLYKKLLHLVVIRDALLQKRGVGNEENHEIRYMSKFMFYNSHTCILDSYCLCAPRDRITFSATKTCEKVLSGRMQKYKAKSPIGRVLLCAQWSWNEHSPDLNNMVFSYSSSFQAASDSKQMNQCPPCLLSSVPSAGRILLHLTRLSASRGAFSSPLITYRVRGLSLGLPEILLSRAYPWLNAPQHSPYFLQPCSMKSWKIRF